MLKTKDLYDLSHTKAAPILENTEYPWEALDKIKYYIIELGRALPKEEYDEMFPDHPLSQCRQFVKLITQKL